MAGHHSPPTHSTRKQYKLDRLWRAARNVASYKEDSTSSDDSSEEDFEDGLNFEEDELETVERIRTNRSVDQTARYPEFFALQTQHYELGATFGAVGPYRTGLYLIEGHSCDLYRGV